MNAYTLKTGKDAADVAAIMAAETWYDGKQAVDAGFCDKLKAQEVINKRVEHEITRILNGYGG